MKRKLATIPTNILIAAASLFAHGLILTSTTWFLNKDESGYWFSFSQTVVVFFVTAIVCCGLLKTRKWAWWMAVVISPLLFALEIWRLGLPIVFNFLSLFLDGFEIEQRGLIAIMSVAALLLGFSFLLIVNRESRAFFRVYWKESTN